MAANKDAAEIRAWLRASGESITSRGAIPARLKEKYWTAFPERRPAGAVRLLPGPDATDEDLDAWEDLGVIGPESDTEPPEDLGGIRIPPEPPGEPVRDSGPAHGRKDWRKDSSRKTSVKQVRVTAAVRGDIEAKISLLLDVPGRIWEARDPVCGGTWVKQVPDMAAAWARYVCSSPQLLEWFTSTGSGFILLLDILAATYPVAAVVMAHHVYHTIGEQGDAQQPDYSDYAA